LARRVDGKNELTVKARVQSDKAPSTDRPALLAFLFLLLGAPSIYMFLRFPPLWRDSDGFYQIHAGLGELTILHWPPLYCFLARIPIALGDIITTLFDGHGFPGFRLLPPVLTDLGIYLLIFFQHLLLIGTLFLICISITASPLTRISIASLFALSPPLYAFAHSVGSESLSNVLTLLSAVLAYKCLCARDTSRKLLYWLIGVLAAAILTRHVNGILVALLPATYLLLFGFKFLPGIRSRISESGPSSRSYPKEFLKYSLLAGLSVGIAHLVVLGACLCAKTSYRSKVGATFEWRLYYLAGLPENSREQILKKVDRNLHDAAVSFALKKGNELLAATNSWSPTVLHLALSEWLNDHGVTHLKKLHLEVDRRLNLIAFQFLVHGGPDFRRAVMHDLWASLNYDPADICHDAFSTTDLFVQMSSGPAFVPVRQLSTIRPRNESFASECSRDPYLTIGQGLPIWAMLLAFLALALWSLFRWSVPQPEISLFAISLIITGIVISIANCALTTLLARFTLPLYVLLLFGLAMELAVLADSRGR
jgi:hypothetical protein